MEFLQGKLLVASPALHDPNFRKTVVLVAHHDQDGAMGLVLSRPSDVSAAAAAPALDGLPGSADPVFVGGPVQPEALIVLAEFDEVEEAAAPIFDRLGFTDDEAEPSPPTDNMRCDPGARRVTLTSGCPAPSPGHLTAG